MAGLNIDEIRREWSELSRRVERERIVTPEMLRAAVKGDAGKLRRYGWLNVAAGLLFGFFLLFEVWNSERMDDVMIPLTLFFMAGMASSAYQIRVYMRADDPRMSLVERERMLIGYSRFSRAAMRWGFTYMAAVFGLKIVFDFIGSSEEWWSFLLLAAALALLFVSGYALAVRLERWEQRRIESLKHAMRELEDFLRECE